MSPNAGVHGESDLERAISRSRSELRRETVHLHLVVLVVRPRSDGDFNHLAHRVDRFAFPDAEAESVIVRCGVDGQRDVGRKPTLECLGFGGLKALGVMNSMDDCHKHDVPSIHLA